MAPQKAGRGWFKRAGWLYVPKSLAGALVLLLAAAFCVDVTMVIAPHAESLSDLAYAVIPYFICAFLMVDWIAGRTSK